MNRLVIACCILISFQGISQSKLVAVSKSELTGIELPAGSKQDNRILSTAAAKTLLQMKAEENTVTLEDKVEVFSLPPSNKKEVKLAVQTAGWEIKPFTDEATYSILKGNGRIILMYLESSQRETSLYFMPVASMPQEAPVVQPAQQTQSLSQPVVQQQTKVQPAPAVIEQKVEPATVTSGVGFTFTTTNFDDGWVSTIAPDFVRVTKGNIQVRIYFSEPFTDEIRNMTTEFSEYFWNKLVVPNFNVKSATRLQEPGYTYFRTYFIEGDAIDPRTGKSCYLALNVLVNSGITTPVLAIAPDRNSYYQQFPEPKNLGNMTGCNKFAVGPKDIVGSWEESSSAGVNLYNSYTGNYAGTNSAQSYAKFTFNEDLTYISKHSGASTIYGTTTAFTQEYKGKLTVTNWDMSMTNRWEGATDSFNCYFEAVRGGRILHLQDKKASGIQYHLVRTDK